MSVQQAKKQKKSILKNMIPTWYCGLSPEIQGNERDKKDSDKCESSNNIKSSCIHYICMLQSLSCLLDRMDENEKRKYILVVLPWT